MKRKPSSLKSKNTKRVRISHSKRKGNTFFKRWPLWTLWVGGILITIGYIFAFYYFFVGPVSFRWKALYGDAKYPEGYSIQGIDISHYQGEIDWPKLRRANIEGNPVRFIIIKATEGTTILDENFNENFYQAKEYGFIRGAYHFFVPSVSAEAQAKYFLKQVHLEDGDFPPVLDIEHIGKLTDKEIKKAALNWLHIVEKRYNIKPIIYTNYKFKLRYLNDSAFNTYPYWIAHYYVDKIEYKGQWKLWQHTDCGRLDGIKGPVDFDIYNGSMYDLMKFTIGHKEEIQEN